MTTWEVTPAGPRARRGTGPDAAVSVTAEDWTPTGSPDGDAVTGETCRLRVPAAPARVRRNREAAVAVTTATAPLSLGDGEHVLEVDAAVPLAVAVPGPATVRRSPGGVVVDLPARRQVTLSARDDRAPHVTVPGTPAGAAAAVSALADANSTGGAARSHPTRRPAVPRVELGETVRLPDCVPDGPLPVAVEVPERLEAVFAVAPLAYYLGARVAVEPGTETPRVRARGAGVDRALDPVVRAAPELLERVFGLDCLVRTAAGSGSAPAETRLLGRLDLDPAALVDAPAGERLAAYLGVAYGRVAEGLPDWHLATYVAPRAERITALPALCSRLAHVYPPETTALEGRELMKRSLDDFYRGGRPSPSVDVVRPALSGGRLHGWLADETPIDVFTVPPGDESLYGDPAPAAGDRPLSVTVVCNDDDMATESDAVAAHYEHAPDPLRLDVTRHDGLHREGLADALAADTDLLHYVGHCEPDGLVCPDGRLAASDVGSVGARTVVLNACGSYHEGRELVRRGARAGAVTFREVLDSQASTVGSAFARLAAAGFSVERAVRLARRRVLMGKDYAVVGDGTHRLVRPAEPACLLEAESLPGGGYDVTAVTYADAAVGDTVSLPLPDVTRPRLRGGRARTVLSADALAELLADHSLPVLLDGTFLWSDRAASDLAGAPDGISPFDSR